MRFYWPIAKVDGEQRMVWGYASTDAEDDQGETVTRTALEAALDDYMRFANIREMHQPSAVGVATEAAIDDRGLYLGAKIVDPDAWTKIVEGVYKGFSIGGRVTARDAADRRLITGLTLTEISVVDRPANPEAVFDCWKRSVALSARDGANAAGQETASGGEGDAADHADPGYQTDGMPRFPVDSARHIRAAWAFIHQPGNARRYSAEQLARVKARIAAAWQAQIDPAGPPAAAAGAVGKRHDGAARLAQIIADLDEIAGDPAAMPLLSERLQASLDDLSDLLGSLVCDNGATLPNGGDLAALAATGALRKARRAEAAPLASSLAKLADEILPRLDALQKRVEDIARTPLPPQTLARGVGISKREDTGGAATAGEDIVAALARMSEEERTLTLIKAAHARPIADR